MANRPNGGRDRVIDADVVQLAEAHLGHCLHPAVLSHSQRVRHLALSMASAADDLAALQIAALFHDAGTASDYNGPDRFEVEGAHAAARFLAARGWAPERIKPIWDAIALHTSPGIAENAGSLPCLIRKAVLIDFGSLPNPAGSAAMQALELSYPRDGIERILADLVVKQALGAESVERKAPRASWPGLLTAGHSCVDPITGLYPNF
jgi:HD domain